jgi:protein-disulfide isomerase-like protein with CxxC motif
MAAIKVTHFTDPGCPWAYSASPALATLHWRYGDQLEWRLVMIGLVESAQQYLDRGYTPERMADLARFERYGMPLGAPVKRRIAATSRACRAIIATRLSEPARETAVFRAIQFAQFTTALVIDDDEDLGTALADVPGIDAAAIVGAIDSPEVVEAYERDRAEARTAAGSPTEAQGKAAQTDGPVRYTAPSLIFTAGDGHSLEAGGFQPVEAYDVCLANLDPGLARRAPASPEDLSAVLALFPDGLATAEVAAVMTGGNDAPDVESARAGLEASSLPRMALSDDALWGAPVTPVA